MSNFNYVTAHKLKNYLLDDPLLDWLELYGHLHAYSKDQQDPNHDFNLFIQEKQTTFKSNIMSKIEIKVPITIVDPGSDLRRRISQTLDYIYLGKKIIYQGVLFSDSYHLIGAPDLIISRDCMEILFPHLDFSKNTSTYYPVNIEFLKLHLNKDGFIQNTNKRYQCLKAKSIIDSLCLNEFLGCQNSVSVIISKSIQLSSNSEVALNFDSFSYGQVDYLTHDQSIYQKILQGCRWLSQLKSEGHTWSVTNVDDSIIKKELYPNMVNREDFPWHSVKTEIASKIQEITLLYHCGTKHREYAFQKGLYQWSQCDSSSLKIGNTQKSNIVNKMIDMNQYQSEIEISPRVLKNHSTRENLILDSVEFYVDFETVINFEETSEESSDSDTSILFMIGCLCVQKKGNSPLKTEFKQFTCENLHQEWEIIDSWISYMNDMISGWGLKKIAKIYHWSHAEPVIMKKLALKYKNSELLPSRFQWIDLLQIFKQEPIILKDVFGYGLKAVVKKLYQLGFIQTTWPQSEVMDGRNAMIYAWLYYTDKNNQSSNIMEQIEHYNFIDCQVLFEITSFLRTKI